MNKKDDYTPQATIMVIKSAIRGQQNSLITTLLADFQKSSKFPEFMQAAVYYGNLEVVKALEKFGCSLTSVPSIIVLPDEKLRLDCEIDYLPAPYMIQAACKGHM